MSAHAESPGSSPTWVEESSFWLVTSYAQAREVFRDPATYRQRPAQENVLLFLDGAAHTRQRRLLERSWTPGETATRAASISAVVANQLVDDLAEDGIVDVMDTVIEPAIVQTLATLVGISPEPWLLYRAANPWTYDPPPYDPAEPALPRILRAKRARELFSRLLDHELKNRIELSSDCWLARMAEATLEQGDRLSREELLTLAIVLDEAAVNTTCDLVTSALWHVLKMYPNTGESNLRIASIKTAVEESLRLSCPLRGLWRCVGQDTRLGSAHLASGEYVLVSIFDANRDEQFFENANQFLTSRPNTGRHLSFGRGPHTCVGSPIARAEARAILEVMLGRWPMATLAGPSLDDAEPPSVRGRSQSLWISVA